MSIKVLTTEKTKNIDIWLSLILLQVEHDDIDIHFLKEGEDYLEKYDYYIDVGNKWNPKYNRYHRKFATDPSIFNTLLWKFRYTKLLNTSAVKYLCKHTTDYNGCGDVNYKISPSIAHLERMIIKLKPTNDYLVNALDQVIDKTEKEGFNPDDYTYHEFIMDIFENIPNEIIRLLSAEQVKENTQIIKQIRSTRVLETDSGARVGILDEFPILPSTIIYMLNLQYMITRGKKTPYHIAVHVSKKNTDPDKLNEVITDMVGKPPVYSTFGKTLFIYDMEGINDPLNTIYKYMKSHL